MLTDDQLNHFQDYGILFIDEFLPSAYALALSQHIDELSEAQQLRQASIGKAQTHHVDTNQRGDLIHWIDPQTCAAQVQPVYEPLVEIRQLLNRHFYLGLRDFECHLTQYPIGTYYKRHVDRHKNGSSRRVSVVYYLSTNWQPGCGGELLVYTPDRTFIIEPRFGRLALFLSELEHEVLPTNVIRKSLTGWMLNEEILSFKNA